MTTEAPAAEPAPVPFQYATAEQRRGTDRFGMWVFLVTELMLFGALFTGYLVYRVLYPTAFAAASQRLDLLLGSADTIVLLASSVTMALAARGARVGSRRALALFLALTFALGFVFLVLKLGEYVEHYQSQLAPGLNFAWTGPNPAQAELFFVFYFVLTGLHAIHLTIGLALIAILFVLARRGHFRPATAVPVELTTLYWHFVDIVWTFIFPLLYLIGRH